MLLCALAVSAYASDISAPSLIAKNIELTTYRNIPICGRLSAESTNGEGCTYNLEAAPKKGTAQIDADGTFTYTPEPGKSGKDSFTFTAISAGGTISNTAQVSVTIKRQSTDVEYCDMEGSSAAYAAVCLAENDIYTGRQIAGKYFFCPDEPVSKAEFLAMCLKLADIQELGGIQRTGFHDDSTIPSWSKPYIASALMSGVISGKADESGNINFCADETITLDYAASALNNVLQLQNVSADGGEENQAISNLIACSVMSEDYNRDQKLTMADAALLLSGAVSVLDSREDSFSLLSWAK